MQKKGQGIYPQGWVLCFVVKNTKETNSCGIIGGRNRQYELYLLRKRRYIAWIAWLELE